MTVTFKGEIGGGSAINAKGSRSYTRRFKLNSDSRNDKEFDVGSHASLPNIGDAHPRDSKAFCHTLRVENPKPVAFWLVTAEYSDERDLSSTNPENDEVLVSFASEIYQEEVWFDIHGGAVANSAGDPFLDPVPTRDAAHLIATIQANVQTVPAYVLTYQNAINDSAIMIGGVSVAESLAKVQRVTVSPRKIRNGTEYYEITLEIHIHLDGWRLELLDYGYRQIVGANCEQIENTGDFDQPTSPVLLDGNGNSQGCPAVGQFLPFDIYRTRDFTALPGIT